MASFVPDARLRGRVLSIDIVENDESSVVVLPSTSAVMGFQFRGRVRNGPSTLSPAGITGIQPSARTYSYLGSTGSVLVRFTPEGATCLGVPAGELAGRSVPLDALLPAARVAETSARLIEAGDAAKRAAVVEALLLELPFRPDPLVTRAIPLLAHPGSRATVADVAGALGTSERQLERRFVATVGVTPKRFAMLRRFERAVALVPKARSLTAVAIDAGYCDQSHFIRDVRRFAGAAPSEVFRLSAGMSDSSNR